MATGRSLQPLPWRSTSTHLSLIFPTGTLNHFARDLGLEWFADTARAVEAGQAAGVDVAVAAGLPFVNTSSIGGYPQVVRRRDELAGRLGRWFAPVVATAVELHRQQLRVESRAEPVEIARDGEPGEHATSFDFGKLSSRLVVYCPSEK